MVGLNWLWLQVVLSLIIIVITLLPVEYSLTHNSTQAPTQEASWGGLSGQKPLDNATEDAWTDRLWRVTVHSHTASPSSTTIIVSLPPSAR